MPLSVKDGMGAWIKDFQDSNAPQFKGKSEKERREMAIAAYMDAKRGAKDEGYVSAAQRKAVHATKADGGKGHPDNKKEAADPPFTPTGKAKGTVTDKSGAKHTPMSRARDLARRARDRNMKKESVELEEMYASTTEPHKSGHRPKVVKTQPNGKTTMSYLGQHVYKSKEHARNAADHIAKGMRKGRASDSYIDDFARRHHKEHGMKESTQIDELDTKTYKSYSDKAGKELMRRDISPDKRSKRALGRATADMKKYGDKRTLKQRIRQDLNKESVDLGENVKKAYEIMKPTKSMNHGIEAIKKHMKVDHNTATNMAKQVMDKVKKGEFKEAKDSDQKLKDHLKFATSKSPAVQNYLNKRKADRDAMNKKNDPNAAKKGYALTAVPPERKYQKLQKAKKAGKA